MRSRSRSKHVRNGSASSGTARLPASVERVASRLSEDSRNSSRSSRERVVGDPVPAQESVWAKVMPTGDVEPDIVPAQRSARSCISGSIGIEGDTGCDAG